MITKIASELFRIFDEGGEDDTKSSLRPRDREEKNNLPE